MAADKGHHRIEPPSCSAPESEQPGEPGKCRWGVEDADEAEEASSKQQKKAYGCRFCPMRFSKSQALGGHMNRHRPERAWEQVMNARRLLLQQQQDSPPIIRRAYRTEGIDMNRLSEPDCAFMPRSSSSDGCVDSSLLQIQRHNHAPAPRCSDKPGDVCSCASSSIGCPHGHWNIASMLESNLWHRGYDAVPAWDRAPPLAVAPCFRRRLQYQIACDPDPVSALRSGSVPSIVGTSSLRFDVGTGHRMPGNHHPSRCSLPFPADDAIAAPDPKKIIDDDDDDDVTRPSKLIKWDVSLRDKVRSDADGGAGILLASEFALPRLTSSVHSEGFGFEADEGDDNSTCSQESGIH